MAVAPTVVATVVRAGDVRLLPLVVVGSSHSESQPSLFLLLCAMLMEVSSAVVSATLRELLAVMRCILWLMPRMSEGCR